MTIHEQPIRTAFIRLDAFLKLTGRETTGGQAKAAIQEGRFLVNGEVCLQRGRKLRPGDIVSSPGAEDGWRVTGPAANS